jgi:hypothetical protein
MTSQSNTSVSVHECQGDFLSEQLRGQLRDGQAAAATDKADSLPNTGQWDAFPSARQSRLSIALRD